MNKTTKYLLFSFAYLAVGLVVGFQINANMRANHKVFVDGGLSKLEHVIEFIEEKYVEESDREVLIEDAIRGIMDGLDPHSFYIPPDEMEQMEEQLEGQFEGIGIYYEIISDTVFVVELTTEGPSATAGIEVGDKIIAIDSHPISGVKINPHLIQDYLKGPLDSTLTLAVIHADAPEVIKLEISRAKIPLPSVDYSYMIHQNVGYIKITRFAETTHEEFLKALTELKLQGMENLILDLRNNPGGYMNMAYKVADEFLSAGKLIVSTEGRIKQSRNKYEAIASKGAFEKGGLVILIDYGTASASEIVAGAVQDHDRGLIVGLRSFGKGLVQIEDKFDDGSAIRLVISEYFTPSGRCIQKPYHIGNEEYAHEIEKRFESGEMVDPSKIQYPDSLMYKTRSGRIVYGGGGIVPDIFIPDDTIRKSIALTDLIENSLFRLFSFVYTKKFPSVYSEYPTSAEFLENFRIDQTILDEFYMFLDQKNYSIDKNMDELVQEDISIYLKAYIGGIMFQDSVFIPITHTFDQTIQKAIELVPVAQKLEKSGKLLLANR